MVENVNYFFFSLDKRDIKMVFYPELTIFHTFYFFSFSQCTVVLFSSFMRVCVCVRAYLSRVYFKYTLNSYRIKKMFIYPNAVIQIILLLLKWRISWLRTVLYKSCHHHDPGVFISRSFGCWFISLILLLLCFLIRLFVCSFVHRRATFMSLD